MIEVFDRFGWYVLRLTIAAICCLGICSCLKLARADYLARLDTAESLRAAIRLEPDAWRYYIRLADFDEGHAQQILERSLQLDRYDAEADIDLGLYFESTGNYPRAEKLLLDAFSVDHTFAPRWALTNFYLRRNNLPSFWIWARRTAEIRPDNLGALFELCWHESPNPSEISAEVLNGDPSLMGSFVQFLLVKNQLSAAASAAQRLIPVGNRAADVPEVLTVINRLAAVNNGASAYMLWRQLIGSHWIVADATPINNPRFARIPLPVSFDWTLPSCEGLRSWAGPEGLDSEFSGEQPEACVVAGQSVFIAPGKYVLEYSYRTSEMSPATGLRWQIVDVLSGAELATTADLSSDKLQDSTLSFVVPKRASLLQVRLVYQRESGTSRIAGMLVIPFVQIKTSL